MSTSPRARARELIEQAKRPPVTADHAGQTGGEREAAQRAACLTNWPEAESGEYNPSCCRWPKSCSIPSRPVPVPGQPDARGRVGCDCGAGLSSCAPGCACDSCDRMRGRAGQAAREAAVEAVARALIDGLVAYAESFASCYDNAPDIDWREAARIFVEDCDVPQQILDLPAVAALSAAPGQEPAHEWNCPSCGATTRARMADHPGQEQP